MRDLGIVFKPSFEYFKNEKINLIQVNLKLNFLIIKHSNKLILILILISVRQNAVRTSLDFPGLPRTFTSFCENYTIKNHIWSLLKILIFFNFLAISEKITKNENFQNIPIMTFDGLK